jgi:hypothetical protein
MEIELQQKYQDWLKSYKSLPLRNNSQHYLFILDFLKTARGKEDVYIKLLSDVGFMALNTRAKLLKINISEEALMVLASLSARRPHSIMWAYIAKEHMAENNLTYMGINDVEEMFSQGCPYPTDLDMLWENQKLDGEINLLDVCVFP